MSTVIIERIFNATIERVWQAITDKEQMKRWYFDLSDFKPEIGFEFSFPGQGHEGALYLHICTIKEVVVEKKLAYSWTYKDQPGYSVVTFELIPEEGGTRVKLTHEGLESFPRHPDFAKESFAEGWRYILGTSLDEFLESSSVLKNQK